MRPPRPQQDSLAKSGVEPGEGKVTRRGDHDHCSGCPVEVCYIEKDRELCREVGERLQSTRE